MSTEVPDWLTSETADSWVLPDNKENLICASACFLIYAGGVGRLGNYLALHRPYLSKDSASKLSDIDYEVALKKEMVKVREYLQNMEIESFFIDKLISTNSQNAYVVTVKDKIIHHLGEYVPSIEEIILINQSINRPTLFS